MIVRDTKAGGLARVNPTFTEQVGYVAEELAVRPLLDWIEPTDRARFQEALNTGHGALQCRHRTRQGGWVAFDWEVRSEGQRQFVFGVLPGRKRAKLERPKAQPRRLPDSMVEVLEAMTVVIEDKHPGMKCSVLLLDDGGHVSVGAGPSLPADYNLEIEGLLIGPGVGSCGTAAYWNERIIVEDIQNDPLWRDLRKPAEKAGLGACWSQPITAKSGEVLGAVALYNPTPRAPTQRELEELEVTAHMFGLAIERGRAEQALRASEEGAQLQSRLLSAVTEVVTSFVDTDDWKSAGTQLVQAALDLTKSEYGFLGEVHGQELRVLAHKGVVWNAHEGRTFYTEALQSYEQKGYLVFPNLDTLFGHVITSGQAVLSNDAKRDDRSANRLPAGHPELRNFLGAPISNGTKVDAMIAVANSEGGYSDQDIHTAEFLCRAGSVLFDRYRRNQRASVLEEQLHEAAKMEALGVLAGGLAHDFNNMLATVLGNAELAMMMLPEDGRPYEMLRSIVTASSGATELCSQMLAYAGRGRHSTKHLECNDLIREFGGLLQVTLSKKAKLEYELSEDELLVKADKAQLGQVLMNLITNAAEAVGNDVGRIVVSTDLRHYDEEELERLQPPSDVLAAGDYVRIKVADTGSGMTAETQAKIFDPFFTTKFTGRGLGLAAVHGIVRRHLGGIELESKLGEGTTFSVILPRAEALQSESNPPAENARHLSRKRVLVVDDESNVRQVLVAILENAGFEVLSARDGREAIKIFGQELEAIDCVLLDLSMPELDGEETFIALKGIKHDVRVVLNSGYTEQEILDRFEGAGLAGVVKKPTPSATLVAKIHEALG